MQCLDDSEKSVEVVGIQQPISIHMIYVMPMKCCVRKGCHFLQLEDELDEGENQDDVFVCHPILEEFLYVFPSEILGMLPKRDIDFRIDLIPGEEPICKTPYQRTTQ